MLSLTLHHYNNKKPSPPPFNSPMEPQGAAGKPVYRCRFCGVDYPTRQSLGGHSNVHRRERAQQQMQAVEVVRRFRYVPYDGYVWATEDDSTYYQMRPLHPALDYAIQHHDRLKLQILTAPWVMLEDQVFNSNSVGEGPELDLTLRL